MSILPKIKRKSEEYISELEDKIVTLSLKLRNKTNELNSVNEVNKKTIGKLVHNLKNPIGVVYSFSDMIIEDVEDYTTEKLEKHLQVIKNSAEFSLQFLNSIAKYSQLQSPDLKYDLKTLNYINIVTNVIAEFNSIAEEKNIRIETDLPESLPFLQVDEAEISLAIKNILNNAFRYSNEKSTIKITIKENLNTVETIINDEGIGISEENLPYISTNFFVVNTYSEDKQKCIGLGLSIANKIVEHHKGKILITSVLHKGSSIKILLPKN